MAMQRLQVGTILAIGILGVAMSVLAAGLLTAYPPITNTGIIKALKVSVYEDPECTKNVTAINWGVLEPSDVALYTIYIKNEGNTPLTLSMTTNNWNPENAAGYITLAWNREGTKLNASSVIQATLTLTVSSNIAGITNFSFEIIIAGTETS